jgi:hypothetical protein
VYFVTGLRTDDVTPPCTAATTSRWIRHQGSCEANGLSNETQRLDAATAAIAISAVQANADGSDDKTPDIRDVKLADYINGSVCDADVSTLGAAVEV